MRHTKTAAVLLTAAIALAPTAHAEPATDWTGGRPLPPGTAVPFEPGYASAWKMYDVVRPGDPNFRNYEKQGIRVLGRYDSNQIMCLMNMKGGLSRCYVDGKPVTDLGWGTGGMRVTTDPAVASFAPLIQGFYSLERRLSNLSSSLLR